MSVGNATRTGAGAPDSDSAKQGPIVSTEGLTKGWTAVVSGDDIACHFNITNRSLSATIPTIKLSAGAWAEPVCIIAWHDSVLEFGPGNSWRRSGLYASEFGWQCSNHDYCQCRAIIDV